MSNFIFMLTRNDETIQAARACYEQVADAGIRHIGFKDVGLPRAQLVALMDDIRANGHTAYIEVVSETPADTLKSARMAAELEPDYLIGGTLIEPILEIIQGTNIRFFPYIGQIIEHPCLLRGSVPEICQDASRVQGVGVDGINLLAYRYDGDVGRLISEVQAASTLPLICAGSVNTLARVRELRELGVWGFTVGTAVLDHEIVPGAPLRNQLEAVLLEAEQGDSRRASSSG